MRVIDEATLRRLIREPEALESAERAFTARARGEVIQPMPIGLELETGEIHVKAAAIRGDGVVVVKVASGFYGNAGRGLPSGSGAMLVLDAGTGFPTALLVDNGYLTDLRTAAAGALAARLLSPERLGRVCVLGSGVQARLLLKALTSVRKWDETVICGRTVDRVQACCREVAMSTAVVTRSEDDIERAVRSADLVFTATASRSPLLNAGWLEPHATVISVGADGPDKCELAVGVLLRADRVFADSREQSVQIGELHHAEVAGQLDQVQYAGEVGEVLTGAVPGRMGDEMIVCDLTGMGVQDAAIAAVAMRAV